MQVVRDICFVCVLLSHLCYRFTLLWVLWLVEQLFLLLLPFWHHLHIRDGDMDPTTFWTSIWK